MASIQKPRKGMPAFVTFGSTVVIVVTGTSVTNNWSVVLRSDLMPSTDTGWPCTSVSATAAGNTVTITAVIPASASPELLDLYVSQSSVGTMVAVQAVAVKTTLSPTTLRMWWRTDIHGRTESVSSSATTDEKQGQFRTWKNISDQNEALTIFNFYAIANTGDLVHKLNSNGVDIAESGDLFARYAQETRALGVPEISIPGNHDIGRAGTGNGRTQDLIDMWVNSIGPLDGNIVQIANNFRVLAHDYGSAVSKSAITTALLQTYAGATLLLGHYTDWDGFALNENLGTQESPVYLSSRIDAYLFGHLHYTNNYQSDPREQMLFGAQKYGVGWPITWTRSGNDYGYGTSFSDLGNNTVKLKLLGDYGAKKLTAAYSQPNTGTATSQTVTVSNSLGIGTDDGRLRLQMARGTYDVTGATILKQYDYGSGSTAVLCQITIPSSGNVTVTATKTGGGGGDQTTPDPTPTTSRTLPLVLFYGLPSQDASGTTISNRETFFKDLCKLYIIRSRSDIGTGNPYNNFRSAGYTGPALLYQRGTEVQTSGTLIGSQWNDNSTALQTYYDAMVNDANCYLYTDNTYTTKITSISDTGYYFDFAHPKVRDYIKRAGLKHLQAYTDVIGYFFDNMAVYQNAASKSSTGQVWSKYLSVKYDRATMNTQEQSHWAEFRAYLAANLGRAFVLAGNLLSESQSDSWLNWSMDGIFVEGIVGYTQNSQYDSTSRMQAKVANARAFLANAANNFVMLVHQAASATATTQDYAFGTALAIVKAGNNAQGIPYTSYRLTNSNYYGRYWPQTTEYGQYGAPSSEPTSEGATIRRSFVTGALVVDTSGHTMNLTVVPEDDGGNAPAGTGYQFIATVAGVRADQPTVGLHSGETLAIDGVPDAWVLVKVDLGSSGLPALNSAKLAMPVASGGAVTPHVQLVESFDPATVTWNTRPRALSLTYPMGISLLTSSTTVTFDVTNAVRQTSNQILYLALMMDTDSEIILHPAATLVWE